MSNLHNVIESINDIIDLDFKNISKLHIYLAEV